MTYLNDFVEMIILQIENIQQPWKSSGNWIVAENNNFQTTRKQNPMELVLFQQSVPSFIFGFFLK